MRAEGVNAEPKAGNLVSADWLDACLLGRRATAATMRTTSRWIIGAVLFLAGCGSGSLQTPGRDGGDGADVGGGGAGGLGGTSGPTGGTSGTAGAGGMMGAAGQGGTTDGGGDTPACVRDVLPGQACNGGTDCAGYCDCVAGAWRCHYCTLSTPAPAAWCSYIDPPAGCACRLVYSPQQGNTYCICAITDAGTGDG